MTSYKKYQLGGLALLIGGSLFFTVKTEREFINLVPTEGRENTLVLESDHTYVQQFATNKLTLARLGIHLRPLAGDLPDKPINIEIRRGDQLLATRAITPQFIDDEGASHVIFEPALVTAPGEKLSITVSMPDELSGTVGWQSRQLDETIDASSVQMLIDGQVQKAPGAYSAYSQSRPPLASQIGGLMVLGGLITILGWHKNHQAAAITTYAVAASYLFTAPIFVLGRQNLILFVVSLTALGSMYLLMRSNSISIISSLFAANTFAFTSWFALQLNSGRYWYGFFSLLPAVFLLARQRRLRPLLLPASAMIFAWIIISQSGGLHLEQPSAAVRDVFLDPNQSPSANPITPYATTWENFGSYVGIPVILAAVLGLASAKKYKTILTVGLLFGAISLQPDLASLLSLDGRITPSHLVIISTFALAFFAGQGLEKLRTFLGTNDRLIVFLTAAMVALSLLDIWHVAATVMEYSLSTLL